MAKPKRAPKIIEEPTDEKIERWRHVSHKCVRICMLAAPLVNQYIHSFITMDTTAAVSAIPPGTEKCIVLP